MARHHAVGFSLNGKGYFGTGITGGGSGDPELADFWEYDPSSDQWTQLADLPGGSRAGAVAFTLNSQGYVGLGSNRFYGPFTDNSDHFKDFYKFDPSSSHGHV